jgi:hypothetical protein
VADRHNNVKVANNVKIATVCSDMCVLYDYLPLLAVVAQGSDQQPCSTLQLPVIVVVRSKRKQQQFVRSCYKEESIYLQ